MESGTTIPNEVIDALAGRHISGTELQLVLVLAKLTWGKGRRHAQVTLARLADAMNSGRTTVSRAVARLEEGGVVTKELVPGHPGGSLYAINRDVARWRLRPKEPEVRIQVLRRDGYTCSYCGVTDHDRMTVDHVIPKVRGGRSTWENLVCACQRCNLRKGARTPKEANMPLLRKPERPRYVAIAFMSQASDKDAWEKYIPPE